MYCQLHYEICICRNYPMFSDTLCFRTPPIFHRNNNFLASENMFFGHPLFSDTRYFFLTEIIYFLASETQGNFGIRSQILLVKCTTVKPRLSGHVRSRENFRINEVSVYTNMYSKTSFNDHLEKTTTSLLRAHFFGQN